MSWSQNFPNTFTGQVTNQVTKNHENELKRVYTLLNDLFANHAHTGTGSDGAVISKVNEVAVTMASASTMDIGAAAGNLINVTGTTTITSFGSATTGIRRTLRFGSALTITNSSSILLPTSANITVSAGDILIAFSLGSGVWATMYQPRNATQNASSLDLGKLYHYKDIVSYGGSTPTTATGTMKISLPTSWGNTILRLEIKGVGHTSSENWSADLKGYNSSSSSAWVTTSATLSPNCPFTSVRFGHDGTNCCVLLGTTATTWGVPQVTVDAITSNANLSLYGYGWTISFITSETGITVSSTPTLKTLATLESLNGVKVWISSEYSYSSNTPLIVSHGLTIADPLKCKAEILLKCTTAEAGYSVGDYAINLVGSVGSSLQSTMIPLLTTSTIQANPGNQTQALAAVNKSTGALTGLTNTNWRIVFRIWY